MKKKLDPYLNGERDYKHHSGEIELVIEFKLPAYQPPTAASPMNALCYSE